MKKNLLIIFLMVLGLSIFHSSPGYSQPCWGITSENTMSANCDDNSPWILKFEDNFDGNQLDSTKWELQQHQQGTLYTDGSQEYNSLDNIELSNGYLNIIAKKETVIEKCVYWLDSADILSDNLQNLRVYNYTSSNIWTKEKYLYGKFEIRCKIPVGSFWPSFWLYGEWNVMGTPDKWNEIDVFEFRIGNNIPASNIHYDINGDGETESCSESPTYNINFSDTFNTFTLIWDEYKIEWYINGIPVRAVNKYYDKYDLTPLECSDMHALVEYYKSIVYGYNPMQLVLNLGVEKGNNTPNDSDLPANFIIDYVRIWQKEEQSCCVSHKLYEATENLPSLTSVENYIKAGFDSGISDISGNVTVKNGQNITFRAGDYIELTGGFIVEEGANFTAEIGECITSQSPLIEIIDFPNSFSPDNDGIEDKLFVIVNGATHYTVNVEDHGIFNTTFYVATNQPIYSSPVAIWDGTCNYTSNCWFYHKCDRQRRVTLALYNCENLLISQKTINVDCNTKSLQNEEDSSKNINPLKEIVSENFITNSQFTIRPNPFFNSFTVSIAQPEETDAKIYLTDAYGRQVLGIFNGSFGKGQHSIDVSTDGITKGLYFCIMETPAGRNVVKVIKTE